MQIFLRIFFILLIVSLVMGTVPHTQAASPENDTKTAFSFAITADIREFAGSGEYNTSSYFRGAMESLLNTGPGAFMLGPGDIDPPAEIRWTITDVLVAEYTWFPAAGNHETETPEDMAYLRAYDYGAVNPGPAACPQTTYSFDYGNAHFAVLNEYCDSGSDTATDGDIPDYLYDWLAADLAAATQAHNFVVGHEPAYPLPDMDNGRLRHETDSLNAHPENRDRFWTLLAAYDAIYLCGHTHNTSVERIQGVWQIDAGHARGLGDTGAASTYVQIHIQNNFITYDIYRDDAAGGAYTRMHSGVLKGLKVYLPVIQK